MPRLLAIALLLYVAFPVAHARALSCSTPTLEESVERADIVFYGWVARMDVPNPQDASAEPLIRHTFHVWEVFKGHADETTEIVTKAVNAPIAGSMHAFDPLRPALVFAKKFQGRLHASLCTHMVANDRQAQKEWLEKLRHGHSAPKAE